MYYTVLEIALPACEGNERWQVISDCSVQEILINGKCFKSSANIYLMHLEELDLTSNKKVNVMTFKCGKKCYFNLTITQLKIQTPGYIYLCLLLWSSTSHMPGDILTDKIHQRRNYTLMQQNNFGTYFRNEYGVLIVQVKMIWLYVIFICSSFCVIVGLNS